MRATIATRLLGGRLAFVIVRARAFVCSFVLTIFAGIERARVLKELFFLGFLLWAVVRAVIVPRMDCEIGILILFFSFFGCVLLLCSKEFGIWDARTSGERLDRFIGRVRGRENPNNGTFVFFGMPTRVVDFERKWFRRSGI